MNQKYVVVIDYKPGCGLSHWETKSLDEAETSLAKLRQDLALGNKEHRLKQADIYQLSQDCLYTFHNAFSKDLFEALLVGNSIFHALITDAIEKSGNRLGTFNMTLEHAKTKPDVYPWATGL